MNQRFVWRMAAAGMACFFCVGMLAQSTSGPEQPPISVKTLTHLLEEHYQQPRTLEAEFLERYSDGPKQARIESGKVYFRRPGQMRWEYESPEQKLFLVDGQNTWFYVPFDHTVTKVPVKESSDWKTPLSLLTRKTDLSRLCSRIEVITQAGVPVGHAVLRCVPKGTEQMEQSGRSNDTRAERTGEALSESESFTAVLLEVNATDGELARLEIQQPGGIELEYRFGNWQEDIPLRPEMFHFQVPPGVAIVDGSSTSQ